MASRPSTSSLVRPSVWTEVWEFLASLRLLLLTLGIGAVPLAVGTFFVQKPLGQFNPEQELERLGPQMYALFETFDIFNIYHSWYFQAILLIIALNNVCCTIDRFFLKAPKITSKAVGVIIVHVGVNVILLGAFYSSRTGIEGFMQVFENAPPKNVMHDMMTREEIPLPFSVQLDDFRLVRWEEPEHRLFLVDPQTGKTLQMIQFDPTQPLPQVVPRGRRDYFSAVRDALLGGPAEAVRIEQYLPQAEMRLVATPTDEADAPWVAAVVLRAGHRERDNYLVANAPRRTPVLHGELSVAYVRATTADELAQALAPRPAPDAPVLVVRDQQSGATRTYPVREGAVIETAGNGGVITVLEYVEDFAARHAPGNAGGTRAPRPAIRVELRDEAGGRTAWLLANAGATSVVRNDAIAASFRQGQAADVTMHEVDLVVGPAGERKVVHRRGGVVVTVADAPVGTPFAVPDLDLELEPTEYVDGAVFRDRAVETESGGVPAIQVTLLARGQEDMAGWVFKDRRMDVPEKGFVFIYEQDRGVKEYQSDLSVFKDGQLVKQQEIIVNRYLNIDGYHIYQSSYDQQNERWSGVSIKRDPGIPVIYSGFVMMFLGILFLFYVRPVWDARASGQPLIPEAGSDASY